MKVAVFGAGGIGGYLGGRLALAGADVRLVARGEHLGALPERGLRVRSVASDFATPVPATDDSAEIGPCDAVLVCVEPYDAAAAAGRLRPLVGEETAVVSLQSGIDNEEKLAVPIGERHVLGGASFLFATVAAPGAVYVVGPGSIVFGELESSRSARTERLQAACGRAAIGATVSPTPRGVLRDKLVLVCGTTASRPRRGSRRDPGGARDRGALRPPAAGDVRRRPAAEGAALGVREAFVAGTRAGHALVPSTTTSSTASCSSWRPSTERPSGGPPATAWPCPPARRCTPSQAYAAGRVGP